MNMLRTLLTGPFHIHYESSPVPEPGKGEVLIRLTLVGICGSDVHMFKNGHTVDGPLTIGHEGIGIIEKAGEGVPAKRVGERVVIEPNIPCSHCPECRSGRGNICRNKRIIGVREPGCFAEYIVIPDAFAHSVPDNISDQDAVTIEPAAVAVAALNRSKAKPGDTISVIGLGSIGLLLTHIALSLGYKVLVSELSESKAKVATDLGATLIRGGQSQEGTVEILEKVYEEEEVVTLFECAGSEKTVTMAIEAAPRGAEVILLGLSEGGAVFNPRMISRKGNNIIPSLIYDHPFDFKRCIRLVEFGKIKPGIIVSRYYSLENLQDALNEAVSGKEIKIVIKISGH
jgi:L-iditol 2-dehydrogenase